VGFNHWVTRAVIKGLRVDVLRVDRNVKGDDEAMGGKSMIFRTAIIWVERRVLVLQRLDAQ